MAIFGLQTETLNNILINYFGLNSPSLENNELYLGLGLTQTGGNMNTESFDEVFSGKPFGNYKRARIIFGKAEENVIFNVNEVVFNTASEDWTLSEKRIEMVGIFDSLLYEDSIGNLINPMVVIPLPRFETVSASETVIFSPNTIRFSLTDI